METAPEPLEEGELRPIADRVAGRERPDGEVETDDRAPRSDLGEVQPLQLAALEPQELRRGGARRGRALAEAEPAADASVAVIATHPPQGFARPSAAAIGRAFPGSHRAVVWMGALHWRLPAAVRILAGLRYGSRYKWPPGAAIRAADGVSAAIRYAWRNTRRLNASSRVVAGRLLRHA